MNSRGGNAKRSAVRRDNYQSDEKAKPTDKKLISEFKDIIGTENFQVFLELLKAIGPDARTHRIGVVIAAMLQYALWQSPPDNEETSLGMALISLEENPWDTDERSDEYQKVFNLVDVICREAGMRNERVSSRGEQYSISENAINEYKAWYSMRWE